MSGLPASSDVPADQRLGARRAWTDRLGDPGLRGLSWLAAGLSVGIVLVLVYEVLHRSGEAFSVSGLSFVWQNVWDPPHGRFGAGAFLFGTAVSSFGALAIAAPVSVAISLFLTEMSPRRIRRPIATMVDLLAAIPSVVLGLWAIIVLAPFVQKAVDPALGSLLGWIPLFSGSPSPFGLMSAILVLVIMTVPIVSAVSREVFESVPGELKEGALALGATRWEMIRMVVLPYCRGGIVGAVGLGLGRALGEAIAVTMVIGNNPSIHASLFAPASTLASQLADAYQGASTSLQLSSLMYLAAVLLALAVAVNVLARLIVRRGGAWRGLAGGVAR